MISLDTETTGLDIRHGARPFFVSSCDEEGNQRFWEWEVDPRTRTPNIPLSDLEEVADLIFSDDLVLQNAKFDIHALSSILEGVAWPWVRTDDTLLAGHLLASNQPHDLTAMALHYLGIDIQPLEDALEEACNQCRRWARTNRPSWQIAKRGLSSMPSAKEKCWKFDTWLPRAVAIAQNLVDTHPYWTVLQEYANADTAITIALWKGNRQLGGSWHGMEEELKHRDLWEIYLERRKLLRIAYTIENNGITVSRARLCELREEYKDESDLSLFACQDIAQEQGFNLEMPKGASPNDSLRSFLFDVLKVPPIRGVKSKTEKPTLDKAAMAHYLATLPEGPALTFITTLLAKRQNDTALCYLEGYERFWLPWVAVDVDPVTGTGWYKLHPSLNPTGTDTLRWSSNNPNAQNIKKGEGTESLRYCFGPAPGREWWSLDAKNIELRIPAYAANERAMIDLFEKADQPPYYGSNHLLNFHTAYTDIWDEVEVEVGFDKVGPTCKKRFASTWYQWCKNGGFALQYGAGEATVDRSFHKKGVYHLLTSRFANLLGPGGLNDRCIRHAEKYGYVETLPDRTVNPRRGYPVMCTRTEWGKILPTVPLNYMVQSTAMWWMAKAMVRCQEQLDRWNLEAHRKYGLKLQYLMVLQVHDELVFDFPKGTGPEPWRTNLAKIRCIQHLMAQGGDDIGIPTPVSCTYHPMCWSEGKDIG